MGLHSEATEDSFIRCWFNDTEKSEFDEFWIMILVQIIMFLSKASLEWIKPPQIMRTINNGKYKNYSRGLHMHAFSKSSKK